MTAYTNNNFFMNTNATFKPCAHPDREADHVSRSGSAYWYTDEGVIRVSNHCGNEVASCNWSMIGDEHKYACEDNEGFRAGFASLEDFEENQALEVWIYNCLEFVEAVSVTPDMMRDGRVYTEFGDCAFSARVMAVYI